ncbi:restriction endonuclease subunit S [Lactococcus lactis]|uniref:restriction endonuclease subunit S n=3 Tax=Lactococcus lactis TaxID=1358 RepID=UPI0038D11615
MMSKKSPQLRFEGFTDDWEQRKLGDVISISSEKNGNQFSRADVLSVSREAGVVNQIEYQGRSFAGASIANYRVVHKGDLIYTKSPLKGAPNGIFKTSEAEGIVSPLYAVYQSREANAAFVGWLLSNDNFATHYLYPLVNKGSKNTLLVSDADAISGHLSFPNIEEQAKIVSFFTQLDNLIALHQRKLDLLKEQKKGYLQKMFPKNGAKVPELRFAGFADDWEERKLGDISYKVKEKNKTGEFTETLTNSAEYGIINQRDFFDKDISNAKNLTGYYVVKNDDFVYNPRISNFAPVGPIKRNKLGRTGVMSPLYYVFRTHDIDKNYFEKYFDTVYWHRFMELNGDSGARADRFAIKDSVFVEMPIPYPTMDEQQKIGSFFKQLDDTIALHQRKLDLLKEQKKGFLQKMFV